MLVGFCQWWLFGYFGLFCGLGVLFGFFFGGGVWGFFCGGGMLFKNYIQSVFHVCLTGILSSFQGGGK